MAEQNIPGQGQGGVSRRRSELPLEERRRLRHESRTSQTYKAFLRYLCDVGKFEDERTAEQAATSVLCALEQRLFGEEANDLEAQLPQRLQELLVRCERHESGPPPHKFGREAFLKMVADECGKTSDTIEPVVRSVFSALQAQISEGEIEEVGQQLPADLRALWARPI